MSGIGDVRRAMANDTNTSGNVPSMYNAPSLDVYSNCRRTVTIYACKLLNTANDRLECISL